MGGTDGQYHYYDVWSFHLPTRKWSELTAIGHFPAAREGHAAALVGNVIYVFGGRGVDGQDLGDLTAFKISSMCSYAFPCTGFIKLSSFLIQTRDGIHSKTWVLFRVGGQVTP